MERLTPKQETTPTFKVYFSQFMRRAAMPSGPCQRLPTLVSNRNIEKNYRTECQGPIPGIRCKVEGGVGETGSTQRQLQPLHLLLRSITLVGSFQNRGTSTLWMSNNVKTPGPKMSSKPPNSSTATSVVIIQKPQLK
eukprot:1157253-Pelagomonas_calceolata.AAC.1